MKAPLILSLIFVAVALGETPGPIVAPTPSLNPAISQEPLPLSPAEKAALLFLYEQSREPAQRLEKLLYGIGHPGLQLLKNRVYARWSPHFGRWVYSKTDSRAKLAEPLEALGIGTVLTGTELGGKNPFQKFKLAEDGTWSGSEEGDEDEEDVVWIALAPARLRIETHRPPPLGVAKFTLGR